MFDLLAQFPELPVTVEEGRTALVLTMAFTFVNAIMNGFTAYFTAKNKKEIELAKIAADSAKEIAQINADQAKKAHKELSSQVADVQSTLTAGS